MLLVLNEHFFLWIEMLDFSIIIIIKTKFQESNAEQLKDLNILYSEYQVELFVLSEN